MFQVLKAADFRPAARRGGRVSKDNCGRMGISLRTLQRWRRQLTACAERDCSDRASSLWLDRKYVDNPKSPARQKPIDNALQSIEQCTSKEVSRIWPENVDITEVVGKVSG